MVDVRFSLANEIALNNLARNQTQQTRAIRQLSTGLRVSQARDDAASLAIGSRLAAEGAAQTAASRNTGQAQSFLQVAEGGLSQVQGLVERAKQLAVQASSGTLSDTERGFLDEELQNVLGEIDRIAADTEFNGAKPLAGPGAQSFDIQVGTGNQAEDQIQATTNEATTGALGIGGIDVSTQGSAQTAIDALSGALDQVVSDRASLGATINRFDVAGQALDVAQINTEQARANLVGADIARAITAFTQTQVQGEIGTSVLGESNERRGSIINLFT